MAGEEEVPTVAVQSSQVNRSMDGQGEPITSFLYAVNRWIKVVKMAVNVKSAVQDRGTVFFFWRLVDRNEYLELIKMLVVVSEGENFLQGPVSC